MPFSLSEAPRPRREAAALFTAEQCAAMAADDSLAFPAVCEILIGVISAGLVLIVLTVLWIVA